MDVCAPIALTAFWFEHSQMKSRFQHLLLELSPSLWYRSEKVKAEFIPCVLFAPVSIFGTHLAQSLLQVSL
jgi:hypothetical protein